MHTNKNLPRPIEETKRGQLIGCLLFQSFGWISLVVHTYSIQPYHFECNASDVQLPLSFIRKRDRALTEVEYGDYKLTQGEPMKLPFNCVIIQVPDWTDSTNQILGMPLRSAINTFSWRLTGYNRFSLTQSGRCQLQPARVSINPRKVPVSSTQGLTHRLASFSLYPQFERHHFYWSD